MSIIGKTILLAIAIFLAVFAYACCLVAATSDEDAEKMYRDYQKWKNRKEEEKRWKE